MFRYSWEGQFYQLGWSSASQTACMLIQPGSGQACDTASQRLFLQAIFVTATGYFSGTLCPSEQVRECWERQKPKSWLTKLNNKWYNNIIYNMYLAYALSIGRHIHDWVYNNSLETWSIWAGVNFSLGKSVAKNRFINGYCFLEGPDFWCYFVVFLLKSLEIQYTTLGYPHRFHLFVFACLVQTHYLPLKSSVDTKRHWGNIRVFTIKSCIHIKCFSLVKLNKEPRNMSMQKFTASSLVRVP